MKSHLKNQTLKPVQEMGFFVGVCSSFLDCVRAQRRVLKKKQKIVKEKFGDNIENAVYLQKYCSYY